MRQNGELSKNLWLLSSHLVKNENKFYLVFTLFSPTVFHQKVFSLEAYLAESDKELTNAIADFMDCSIVIPPTEIQSETMLQPIVRFQKKMLRERLRPTDTRIVFGAQPEG